MAVEDLKTSQGTVKTGLQENAINIPGIPIAFSCNPVLTVVGLGLTSSTATVSLLPVTCRKQDPATAEHLLTD